MIYGKNGNIQSGLNGGFAGGLSIQNFGRMRSPMGAKKLEDRIPFSVTVARRRPLLFDILGSNISGMDRDLETRFAMGIPLGEASISEFFQIFRPPVWGQQAFPFSWGTVAYKWITPKDWALAGGISVQNFARTSGAMRAGPPK